MRFALLTLFNELSGTSSIISTACSHRSTSLRHYKIGSSMHFVQRTFSISTVIMVLDFRRCGINCGTKFVNFRVKDIMEMVSTPSRFVKPWIHSHFSFSNRLLVFRESSYWLCKCTRRGYRTRRFTRIHSKLHYISYKQLIYHNFFCFVVWWFASRYKTHFDSKT